MPGKVLVTAGASGIGKRIAAAFLAAGDDVYTCDINAAALESAAVELKGLETAYATSATGSRSRRWSPMPRANSAASIAMQNQFF